jgi:hypothetical protein
VALAANLAEASSQQPCRSPRIRIAIRPLAGLSPWRYRLSQAHNCRSCLYVEIVCTIQVRVCRDGDGLGRPARDSPGSRERTRMRFKQLAAADDYHSDNDLPPPGVLVSCKPYTPTQAQRVRPPFGLTSKERMRWMQDDLYAISGAKGYSSCVADD